MMRSSSMKKATYNKLQGLKNKIQSLEKELEAARQNLAGKSDSIPVGNSQKKTDEPEIIWVNESDIESDLSELEDNLFVKSQNYDDKCKTINGAATEESTDNNCLNLFSTIGAFRNSNFYDIKNLFIRAFAEDNDLAVKILFYARDIREGLGERKTFRNILSEGLAALSKESVIKNFDNIVAFGRYDDLLCLLNTSVEKEVIEYISKQFTKDLNTPEGELVSLLGKWLPSINTSSELSRASARKLAKAFGMNNGEYRKATAKLRNRIKIIENYLREKDYSFDYSKQTSYSMLKYRKAFIRNDKERYQDYINAVNMGFAKLNTKVLYPYDVVRPLIVGDVRNVSKEEKESLDVTWKNLPDYTTNENAIVVADCSGSMTCGGSPEPICVALSLALYFAERNKGLFADRFITFSENPKLVEIKGKNLFDKLQYCMTYAECANTNIQKVFKKVLDTAIANKAPQEEMPARIYIISDMEFDCCAEDSSISNFKYAKKLFEENGYKLPQLVFWNVNSLSRQFPVRKDEKGVILVSGCSPTIFKTVMSQDTDPYHYMMEVLDSPRYADIKA